ncbi:hypothetical protein ACWCO7_34100, partial [Streptomyces violaceorubidus]
GERLWHAIETSDCVKVGSGVCDIHETMYFDPGEWAQFEPAGTHSYTTVKKVHAHGSGGLRTT